MYYTVAALTENIWNDEFYAKWKIVTLGISKLATSENPACKNIIWEDSYILNFNNIPFIFIRNMHWDRDETWVFFFLDIIILMWWASWKEGTFYHIFLTWKFPFSKYYPLVAPLDKYFLIYYLAGNVWFEKSWDTVCWVKLRGSVVCPAIPCRT